MIRVIPDKSLEGLPCSSVAISCALGRKVVLPTSHDDGYMTLKDNNRHVREHLSVARYKYFKRGERPLLRELDLEKAIVCVYGHLIYVQGREYYSFFDNEDDEVVAYWELKG